MFPCLPAPCHPVFQSQFFLSARYSCLPAPVFLPSSHVLSRIPCLPAPLSSSPLSSRFSCLPAPYQNVFNLIFFLSSLSSYPAGPAAAAAPDSAFRAVTDGKTELAGSSQALQHCTLHAILQHCRLHCSNEYCSAVLQPLQCPSAHRVTEIGAWWRTPKRNWVLSFCHPETGRIFSEKYVKKIYPKNRP